MRVCILASSSAGNAIAVRADERIVLVDAGLSARTIEQRLRAVGWHPSELAAILISHEHQDHIRGAGVLARRYRVPIYATVGTLDAAGAIWHGGEDLRPIRTGIPFAIGRIECEPFSVPHDVADPAQYVLRCNGAAVGVATDLGRVTKLVVQKLATTNLAIVEANHDMERLRWGEYPWAVKQRIASAHGHLDNAQAAELAVELARMGVQHIVCAHLSPRHNDVAQVHRTIEAALAAAGLRPRVTVVPPENEEVIVLSIGGARP